MTAPAEEPPSRRVRVTLRCLTDDLGMPIPADTVDLGDLDHAMIREARRLAPTAPAGQKRIESIPAPPLVFRLRHGQFRGAAWVEEEAHPSEIFWVLAVALRRDGDHADAFEYFAGLHAAGRLMPTSDDHLRLRVEAAARIFDACVADLRLLLGVAADGPGAEHSALLGNLIPARAFKEECDGYDAFWLALAVRGPHGRPIPNSLRDVVFAAAKEILAADQEDAVYAWPEGGTLTGHEIARLYVRDR